eukprot:3959504-Pleurochrysis_carterae.AAC.1
MLSDAAERRVLEPDAADALHARLRGPRALHLRHAKGQHRRIASLRADGRCRSRLSLLQLASSTCPAPPLFLSDFASFTPLHKLL